MLSRIAESLYWIGRYVERAEDTSRILDVYLQLLVEDPSVDTQLSTATADGDSTPPLATVLTVYPA